MDCIIKYHLCVTYDSWHMVWWKLYGLWLNRVSANIGKSVLLHGTNQENFCLITSLKGPPRSIVDAIADKMTRLTRCRHMARETQKRQRTRREFECSMRQLKTWVVETSIVYFVKKVISITRKCPLMLCKSGNAKGSITVKYTRHNKGGRKKNNQNDVSW